MKKQFRLGKWLVTEAEGSISSADETIQLEPKTLAVLMVLAGAEGEVVSRETLLDTVWKEQVVGDYVINSSIAALRKALGDDRKENQYIQTLSKKGYKLVVNVDWNVDWNVDGNVDEIFLTPKPSQLPQSNHSKAKAKRFNIITGITGIATVAIVAVFLYYNFISKLETKEPAALEINKSQSEQNQERSIAVLPFDIYSSDPEHHYFADGLAEEMLHQLVINQQLKVMSHSASFRYRDTDKSIQQIAEELKVNYLIQGSIRVFNDQFKITIQLIDAKNNFHLWSRVFDHSTGELFKIQQQVSTAISDMLNVEDSTAVLMTQRNHPDSEEAYKYFLKAQAYMKLSTVESLNKANDLYQQALDLSPDYALAYTGLAFSDLLSTAYQQLSFETVSERAVTNLDRALILDPNQPEAFAVKGLLYTYLKKFNKAENFFLKALSLNPHLKIAHHNYAYLLWLRSDYAKAVTHGAIALVMDPLSVNANFLVGDSLTALARFDDAIEHLNHCVEVLPKGTISCHAALASLYEVINKLDKGQYHINKMSEGKSEDFFSNNFYFNNIYSSYLLRRGEFTKSSQSLQNSMRLQPTDYYVLKVGWLLAVAKDETESFSLYLSKLAIDNPNSVEVKTFIALISYWQGDYARAVKYYELVSEIGGSKYLFDLWDYSDGISHAINLAVSYQQTGREQKKIAILNELKQYFDSFENRLDVVFGALYIKAQYQWLVGNSKGSMEIIRHIESQWNLHWVIEKDPFWETEN